MLNYIAIQMRKVNHEKEYIMLTPKWPTNNVFFEDVLSVHEFYIIMYLLYLSQMGFSEYRYN